MSWIFLSCDLLPCTAAMSLNCLQTREILSQVIVHGALCIRQNGPSMSEEPHINGIARQPFTLTRLESRDRPYTFASIIKLVTGA